MPSKLEIKEKNAEIVKKFGANAKDSGNTEVQVALLTNNINGPTDHFKQNPKDFAGKRGLIKMVGERKRLLAYLKKSDENRYVKLIKALELRK